LIIKMTEQGIADCIKYWQAQLRLGDWEIEHSLVRYGDINCYAQMRWTLPTKGAAIDIADPDTWPTDYNETDMEDSIVHELVHVLNAPLIQKFKSSMTTEEFDLFVEFPTVALAKVLTELHRNKKDLTPESE